MMTTRITYPTNPMTSDVGSRVIKVSGIEITSTVAQDFMMNERLNVIEIAPVNHRGDTSSKFIRVPHDSTTLRLIADTLNTLADQVEGTDLTTRVKGYVRRLRDRLPDDESVTELLDDLIHDVITDSYKASSLNNQGWEAQVWYLVNNGCGRLIQERLDHWSE